MKPTNQKPSIKILRLTALYGYALFAALVLSEIISITFIFSLRPDWIGNGRVMAAFGGLVGALLLPPLVSFAIGYYATQPRNKPLYPRQFNGVVFGICALWLSMALSAVMYWLAIPQPDYTPLHVYQFGNAIIAVVIMLALGVGYRLATSNRLVLRYKPFALVLIVSVITWFIFNLTGGSTNYGRLSTNGILDIILVIEPIVFIPLLYGLSYLFHPMNQKGIFDKLTTATVLTALYLSTALATSLLFSSISSVMKASDIIILLISIIAYPAALLIWGVYLRYVRLHKAMPGIPKKHNF